MLQPPLLAGLDATVVTTPRLQTHVITRGAPDGVPVVLLHGNVSAARFWEETMLAFPDSYYLVAPDMRGFGRSEAKAVDATRGVRDYSDDLAALVEAMDLRRPHLVGWSLGGNVAMQYALDHAADVASLTLVAAGSPYGYGGTQGLAGTANSAQHAGTGGGTANPELVKRIAEGDRSDENLFSPRNVMNMFYFKPPFRSPREDVFVDELLLTVCGEGNYPGNATPADAWPGVGPGTTGNNNALSPKYFDQGALSQITPQPPVLWVRGDADQIVADASPLDFGVLGQQGIVPDWPGPDVYPPQPMVGQLRHVLDAYRANGGAYTEVVLADCGHAPHVEKPAEFQAALFGFLAETHQAA